MKSNAVFQSTKVIELGSCAFRQWRASHSHCRFLHGYQLKAKLWFSGSSLDDKNWVVDFGGLKELKAKLNSIYDHTTTVAADDPELETFKQLHDKGIIQLYILKDGAGIERAAEVVFNIAQEHINSITNGRCWVDKVEVFEHEDNSATFSSNELKYNTTTGLNFNQNPLLQVQETTTTTTTNQQDPTPPSRAANVGPGPISNNMGNPFAGTSWGA
jgi:6-pyruvoyltetrahydropterin/6-carboxytetrahydropterin synthase